MPVYEYQCKDCGEVFEKTMTIHEHEQREQQKKKPTCPKCDSQNVQQQPSHCQVVTSHKA